MSEEPKISEPLDDIAKHFREKPMRDAWLEDTEAYGDTVQEKPFNPAPEGEHTIKDIPVVDNEVNVELTKKVEQNIKAKRFLEMVKGGVPQWEAAKKNGTTIKAIYQTQGLRAAVKNLIETGTLPAAIRKELVRAGLNKIFIENIDGGPREQKLALQAAKQISGDPDVGLNIPPSNISVNVDVTKLNELFKNMKVPEVFEGEQVTEAEFEEIKEEKSDD